VLAGKTLVIATMCIGSALAAVPAHAATLACTTLRNVAQAGYGQDGANGTLASNPADVRVNELLDLRLSANAGSRELVQDATSAVPFTLVNAGNGQEAFLLDGQVAGVTAAIEGFAADSDGNGVLDATDTRIAQGGATPSIQPGASMALFALVRGGTAQGSGTLTVQARAATGSGAPGTDFAGKGDGGTCDAITGETTASAAATVTLTAAPGSDTSDIQIIKTQSIMAPNGSPLTVKGSTITYTIESRFGGSGAVQDARIADPIPQGTAYAPGSMRLDGAALTDSADADAGSFDGTSIHVALGTVARPAVRTIVFQVIVQ
jgi:uncharacterized repeat protein (TIGR01451 family)